MDSIQTLQRWGNSSGIRLSKQILKAANLYDNQRVIITVQDGTIVLSPVKEQKLTLKDLLLGVTPEMVSGEMGWGEDVGAEIYG